MMPDANRPTARPGVWTVLIALSLGFSLIAGGCGALGGGEEPTPLPTNTRVIITPSLTFPATWTASPAAATVTPFPTGTRRPTLTPQPTLTPSPGATPGLQRLTPRPSEELPRLRVTVLQADINAALADYHFRQAPGDPYEPPQLVFTQFGRVEVSMAYFNAFSQRRSSVTLEATIRMVGSEPQVTLVPGTLLVTGEQVTEQQLRNGLDFIQSGVIAYMAGLVMQEPGLYGLANIRVGEGFVVVEFSPMGGAG